MVASRLKNFDSTVFQEVFQKQRKIKNPIDLSIGFPEGDTPQYIKEAGIRAIEDGHTAYTPANGTPELRTAVAEKFTRENNIPTTASDVAIMPGLSTAFLIIYLATTDPGEEIIIMDPSFPPYVSLAEVAGATVKQVPVLENFQLDLKEIEAAISGKTRLIVINTPNNPTGAVYAKKDLEKLTKLARKHNITIVSDEMYESFVYEGEHFSVGSIYPNTITMNGFSKSYAMTGWRLGYVTGPSEIIAAISQLLQYAVFSSSSIAQHAALEALRKPAPKRQSYMKKRELIRDSLQNAGYQVHGSDGAYYTYFKAPANQTDMEFVDRAADKRLLLLPGRVFSKKENFVRLSYGGSIEDIKKGLAIITDITRQAQTT